MSSSQVNGKRKADDGETSQVLEKKFVSEIDKYTTEVKDSPDEIEESEIKSFDNVNYRMYLSKGMLIMPRPKDKFSPYRNLTSNFGYEYNQANGFLCNDGIFDLLELPHPFFSFWNHGLTVYLPRMNISEKEKTLRNMVFKRTYCTTHKYRCDDENCEIKEDCMQSNSIKFFVSGTFRIMPSNAGGGGKKFTTYFIDMDECIRSETSDLSIATSITINRKPNIHILKRCKHDNCGVGVEKRVFPDMPATYSVCGSITKDNSYSEDMNHRRCYGYGRGLTGNYHASGKTIYLNTYNLTDLYIVDY